MLDTNEDRTAFVSGFFFAFNVFKAMGVEIDPKKLTTTLKELAESEVTLALTPTDHLLAMEKAQGKPLTEGQKTFYLSMLSPQPKQDDINRQSAQLILATLRGDLTSMFGA